MNIRLHVSDGARIMRIDRCHRALIKFAGDNRDVFDEIEMDWEDREKGSARSVALSQAVKLQKKIMQV